MNIQSGDYVYLEDDPHKIYLVLDVIGARLILFDLVIKLSRFAMTKNVRKVNKKYCKMLFG